MAQYWYLLATLAVVYLYLLSRRLTSPHPKAAPRAITTADLDNVKYDDVDMRKAIPTQPTNKTYAVIGGSGLLGTYIVHLLLLRGETSIIILDVHPPQPSLASNPSVKFIRTDITSPQLLRDAITSLDHPPINVVFHTAAIICFWERSSFSWPLSYNINVRGVENMLNIMKDVGKDVIVVYTSSVGTNIPRNNFLRLGFDRKSPPQDCVIVSDDDPPLPRSQAPENCYSISKKMAEHLVIAANGQNGMKTGIIRPGCSIMGPGDRLVAATLSMEVVPQWDANFSQTQVCVWDVAAAHLLLEDALTKRPEEVSGEAFLVTGDTQPWKIGDIRNAVRHYASKPVTIMNISPLPFYILMHLIELCLFLRYYTLLPFHLMFFGSKPVANPKWMGELVYLQPMTMDIMLADIVIDDSRARKVLGYRPQWTTAQVIKYAVDEFEAGRTTTTGLKLRS